MASSRLAVRRELEELRGEAVDSAEAAPVTERIGAALAYLDALLGVREPLSDYIQATQGCAAVGWSDDHLDGVRTAAVAELGQLGVLWDSETTRSLTVAEGAVDAAAEFVKVVETSGC